MSNTKLFAYVRKRFVLCLMLCLLMVIALEQQCSLYIRCTASPTNYKNTYRVAHESEPHYRAYKSDEIKSNSQIADKHEKNEEDYKYGDNDNLETEWTVHTSCPSCPMCDRSGTSFANSLRYCNKFTSSVRQFWKSMKTLQPSTHDIYTDELPFTQSKQIRKQALEHIRELLETQLVGQPHVIDPLVQLMRHKMFSPNDPLVIHLAGDNGVGKTFTARLISLALSLHCTSHTSFANHLPSLLLEQVKHVPLSPFHYFSKHNQGGYNNDKNYIYDDANSYSNVEYLQERCESGDALLTIAGSGFDGMPLREARARVVQQVIHHLKRHPHGIILIDDLTVMNPELVKALAPLFGRDAYFPEQFTIELSPWDEMYNSEEHERQKHERQMEKDKQYDANEFEYLQNRMNNVEDRANYTITHYNHGNRGSETGKWKKKELFDKASAFRSFLPSTYNRHSSSTRPRPFKSHHSSSSPPSSQSLSQLTVFITTDFGQQGRTMNKTIDEIHELVRSEFKEVYGKLLPAHMRTFVYAPFSFRTALEMIVSAVRYLPCKFYKSSTMLYSADIELAAAHFLAQRYRLVWEGSENGHALRRIVEDELIAQLMEYWERDDDLYEEDNNNEQNEEDDNFKTYCKKRSYNNNYNENWEYYNDKCRDVESVGNNNRNKFAPLHAYFVLDEQSARVVLQLHTMKLPFSEDL